MNYKQLIKNCKSVRDYKETPIDEGYLDEIITYSKTCNRLVNNVDIECLLFNDSKDMLSKKLQGLAGYNGYMLKAPNYVLVLSDDIAHSIKNAGYIGESIVLKAEDLGISSCWITFEDGDKILDALEIKTDKKIHAIISLGYESSASKKKVVNQMKTGENYSLCELGIADNDTASRLDVDEIVYIDEWGKKAETAILKSRGLLDVFNHTRMAPSTLNRQPWRFLVDGCRVVLAIKDEPEASHYDDQIDAGIVMFSFEMLVRSTLCDTRWAFDDIDYNIPAGYKYIGYCEL
ncbi:MAG: nitroreductase family protein [Clostridioides sp.]|nr:nitroreductase family protein [Clostridioides sp.]